MKGRLIVFEGTDGSGKATQAHMLAQRLRQEKVAFRQIDFPRYGNPFAEPARLYLEGALGQHPGDVNAYAASVLFGVDRYASFRQDWGRDYQAGMLILANRYTTSNAVHQASKLPAQQREEFLTWLFDLEYHRLELPQPDLVIYLDLPTELSEQMLQKRQSATGTHGDIHEQDQAYLHQCRESARQIAKELRWWVVDCAREGQVRPAAEIHQEIWERLQGIL